MGERREKKRGMTGEKKTSYSLCLTLLCLSVLSGCTASGGSREKEGQNKAQEEMQEETKKAEVPQDDFEGSLMAAVQIFSGNSYGGGVIYEWGEDGLILLTAAHVLEPEAETQVLFSDGTQASVDGIRTVGETDGAFLTVSYEDLPKEWLLEGVAVKKDKEQFDRLESGTGVFLADPQADNELGCRFAVVEESWIYVEDFSQHMILLSGQAQAGMSGCGVFDEEGCFLGILCGGNEQGELAVLPYSVIEANCKHPR